MGLYPELDNLNLEQLINRWYDSPLDGEGYEHIYYSELAILIRAQGEAGVNFLLGKIAGSSEAQLRAIIEGLTVPPRLELPGLKDKLLSYLRDSRPAIVMQTIDGLWCRGDREVIDQILALRNHPDPYVRGSVLRYMSHLYPKEATPLLLEALQDPDYIVRENGVDELDELEVTQAIPHIRLLLSDPHPDVREAARYALEHLVSASTAPAHADT